MAKYQVRMMAVVNLVHRTFHNTILLCQPLTRLSKVKMTKTKTMR